MHKVDAPSATPNNEFTDGNPQNGIPATTLESKYMNTVQRELVNVVEGAGLRLNDKDDGQLQKAIKKMIGPPVVIPPPPPAPKEPTMEITRHGPGVSRSIITNSGLQIISTLNLGTVQTGDIIDVQCQPDLRKAIASGFVTVLFQTIGNAQIRSFDPTRNNGFMSWSFYTSPVTLIRSAYANATTRLLVQKGGSLVLNQLATSSNEVRATLSLNRTFAMITRYTGIKQVFK